MIIIQFGLWFNAREIALAAAQAGARVAREEYTTGSTAWKTDAANTATSYYRSLNTSMLGTLSARAVQKTDGGTPDVGVTVSGPMGFSVFSWFGSKWNITETVTGPAECFHPVADDGGCG